MLFEYKSINLAVVLRINVLSEKYNNKYSFLIFSLLKNKTIYLIRHGQTDFNKQGIAQGSGVDTSLNALGRAQGRAFFEAYKDVPFDKIYTSALKRTVETVSDFIDKGIPYQQLPGLNEFSWGCKEGVPLTDENHDYYLQVTNAWNNGDLEACIEGGENPLQVMERQKKALDIIMSNENEQTILICMHGRAMRVLLCIMLDYDLTRMEQFAHDNTCLYKITYTDTIFSIVSLNDISHLSEINSKHFD